MFRICLIICDFELRAKFTPFGHYIICESLTKRVLTKLKMLEYVKRHPSITKIPVKNPIFVIGFPRTGTTFLHEMLGLHPTVRLVFVICVCAQ